MGYRLSDRVLDIKRKLGVCVDLSSGRGYVTRHLTNHSVDQIYAVEFSPTMLSQCELPPSHEVRPIHMNIELWWRYKPMKYCDLSRVYHNTK